MSAKIQKTPRRAPPNAVGRFIGACLWGWGEEIIESGVFSFSWYFIFYCHSTNYEIWLLLLNFLDGNPYEP